MTDAAHSTNYRDTFIQVAEDCPAATGLVPPERVGKLTVASLQHAMISNQPYHFTSDDVVFASSSVARELNSEVTAKKLHDARVAFFSKGQPCLRASALGKKFGWGVHFNAEGRIAIYSVDSERYGELVCNPAIKQVKAMRSKRA